MMESNRAASAKVCDMPLPVAGYDQPFMLGTSNDLWATNAEFDFDQLFDDSTFLNWDTSIAASADIAVGDDVATEANATNVSGIASEDNAEIHLATDSTRLTIPSITPTTVAPALPSEVLVDTQASVPAVADISAVYRCSSSASQTGKRSIPQSVAVHKRRRTTEVDDNNTPGPSHKRSRNCGSRGQPFMSQQMAAPQPQPQPQQHPSNRWNSNGPGHTPITLLYAPAVKYLHDAPFILERARYIYLRRLDSQIKQQQTDLLGMYMAYHDDSVMVQQLRESAAHQWNRMFIECITDQGGVFPTHYNPHHSMECLTVLLNTLGAILNIKNPIPTTLLASRHKCDIWAASIGFARLGWAVNQMEELTQTCKSLRRVAIMTTGKYTFSAGETLWDLNSMTTFPCRADRYPLSANGQGSLSTSGPMNARPSSWYT